MELKAIKGGDIHDAVEFLDFHRPANGEYPEDTDYYLKSEVDGVTAGKDKEIAELRQKLHDAEMRADLAEAAETERKIDYKELKEERRWRKFPEEKPSEEMEGMDFIVSNGFFHREISEWRGYWNNDPFCGDRHCDVVKYWMPMPPEPKEADK